MKKKILSLCLILALVMGVFAGCGGNGTSGTSSKAGAPAQSEDSDAPESAAASAGDTGTDAEVEITIWKTPGDEKVWETEAQERFQAENPNIKLNFVQTPQDSDLLSAMASNTAPTVLTAGYPQFGTLIYQGAFVDITDLTAQDPDWVNRDPVQVEAFSNGGRIYGVPGGKYALSLAYNRRLLEEANLTFPDDLDQAEWTWEKFYEYCETMTDPGKQQYGYGLDIAQWGGWHFEMWCWAAGGDLTKANDDGTLELTFTDPANVKAGEFYRKLIDNQVIQSNINAEIDELKNDFALGRSGFIIGGTGNTADFVNLGMKADDIGFCNMPAGPSGKGYNIDGGDGGGIVYTEDQDVINAAYKYLTFMSSKEVIESQYQEAVDNNTWGPVFCPRTDIDVASFGEMDPYYQQAMDNANPVTKHEFYGKGAVGEYLDDAVKKFGGDSSTDIAAVLEEYQGKAQEAADLFNEQMK